MNHTTMKATAVISEAWRSITSGASRLAPAVLALAQNPVTPTSETASTTASLEA